MTQYVIFTRRLAESEYAPQLHLPMAVSADKSKPKLKTIEEEAFAFYDALCLLAQYPSRPGGLPKGTPKPSIERETSFGLSRLIVGFDGVSDEDARKLLDNIVKKEPALHGV